jgi:hypothetical protein
MLDFRLENLHANGQINQNDAKKDKKKNKIVM